MTVPFDVLGVDHLVLRVADLERASWFYADVLGCTLERSIPDLGLYQYRAGSSLVDLVVIGSRLGGEQEVLSDHVNQDHFCLNIAPFDEAAVRAHFNKHGIECPPAGDRYGAHGTGPSIYVKDPDGNTVEIKAGPS